MKKIYYLIVFVLSFITVAAHAQKDKRAGEILEAVSKKYKATPSFKAHFSYTMESPSSGINESYTGDIAVKGSKFHLNTGEQEIINNGTTVWTYLKESNEVNISDYEPEEDEITPTNIYTIYQKGYKYNFVEEIKENGEVYEVVDLVPENKNSQVFKVRVTVNKKDKSVKSWKIFEKNGNRYQFNVERFTPAEVDDEYFAFNKSKYKGVEVIDLR